MTMENKLNYANSTTPILSGYDPNSTTISNIDVRNYIPSDVITTTKENLNDIKKEVLKLESLKNMLALNNNSKVECEILEILKNSIIEKLDFSFTDNISTNMSTLDYVATSTTQSCNE